MNSATTHMVEMGRQMVVGGQLEVRVADVDDDWCLVSAVEDEEEDFRDELREACCYPVSEQAKYMYDDMFDQDSADETEVDEVEVEVDQVPPKAMVLEPATNPILDAAEPERQEEEENVKAAEPTEPTEPVDERSTTKKVKAKKCGKKKKNRRRR